MLNTVKIWIQLNIPRIEDGNNFGVGIQEEMVNELARAENDAIAVLDSMTKYFISRGRLLHKVRGVARVRHGTAASIIVLNCSARGDHHDVAW